MVCYFSFLISSSEDRMVGFLLVALLHSTMRAVTACLCLSLLHKLSHKDLSALDTREQNSVSTPPPTLCVAFGS